jgi:hypothetical protein
VAASDARRRARGERITPIDVVDNISTIAAQGLAVCLYPPARRALQAGEGVSAPPNSFQRRALCACAFFTSALDPPTGMTGSTKATFPGGGEPSDVKSVFCASSACNLRIREGDG